jgi:hypothetical protein
MVDPSGSSMGRDRQEGPVETPERLEVLAVQDLRGVGKRKARDAQRLTAYERGVSSSSIHSPPYTPTTTSPV